MPQENSDQVELLSDVPPPPFYIHQSKTVPNPVKFNIEQISVKRELKPAQPIRFKNITIVQKQETITGYFALISV